jgi:hypothetical protein
MPTDTELITMLRAIDEQIRRLESLIASLPSSDTASRGSAAWPPSSQQTTRLSLLQERLETLRAGRHILVGQAFDSSANLGDSERPARLPTGSIDRAGRDDKPEA